MAAQVTRFEHEYLKVEDGLCIRVRLWPIETEGEKALQELIEKSDGVAVRLENIKDTKVLTVWYSTGVLTLAQRPEWGA